MRIHGFLTIIDPFKTVLTPAAANHEPMSENQTNIQYVRYPFATYERSETAAGFSAEDLKRAEAQWREQGSPKGLTSD